MRSNIFVAVIVMVSVPSAVFAAFETEIRYETSELGLGRWQYTYEVSNISLPVPIEEFTLWFDIDSYDNLVIETLNPPANNWNEIIWNSEPVIGDDGGYDALAKTINIGVGQHVYGFSVSFDWLGTGRPGTQFYEIINPTTFDTIDTGWTVPEPCTLLLLGLGGVVLRHRWRRLVL